MTDLVQLGAQDAQFLYIEDGPNHSNVTMISVYDPSTVPEGKAVTFSDVIAHVEQRLHLNPLFKRRLFKIPMELDYPYWVDDQHFDLGYHLHQTHLPAPGNWRQFCDCVARHQSKPLDMDRPPWEMLVIEGLDSIDGLPTGSFAIATKIHHAAVDGMAITRFFGSMGDLDNKGTPALSLDTPAADSASIPTPTQIAKRAALNSAGSPKRLFEAIAAATPSLLKAAQKNIHAKGLRGSTQSDYPVPVTRFNTKLSPRRVFDATDFSLTDLKKIRALVDGCTINDVVMAISAGALRRYLQHHNELPDESLVAWVPINTRPAEGMSDGNNISAMTAPIFTTIEDPVIRVKEISVVTQAGKASEAGVTARLVTDLTQQVPASAQVLAAKLLIKSGAAAGLCNLFISNVPGPSQTLYMKGAKAVGSYGMAPLSDGMGLFIATPSYDGRLSFNVQSTLELLPDIEFFIECIIAAKNEMMDCVIAARAAASTRKESDTAPTPIKAKPTPRKKAVRAKRKINATA